MCGRYWKKQRPGLDLPTSLDYWNNYICRLNASSPKGTSVLRILTSLKMEQESKPLTEVMPEERTEREEGEYVSDILETKRQPPLAIQVLNLESIDHTVGFMAQLPPIPLILFFDQSMSQNNQMGGGHAVLLHSFDTKVQQKIFVIDPLRTQLGKPYPWDLDMFYNGWKEMQNLALAVHPYNEKVSINITTAKITSQSLLDFMQDPEQ